jgi:hypothetical protein
MTHHSNRTAGLIGGTSTWRYAAAPILKDLLSGMPAELHQPGADAPSEALLGSASFAR